MDRAPRAKPPSAPRTRAPDATASAWTKPIPQPRDRAQSAALTILVGGSVLVAVLWREGTALYAHRLSPSALLGAAFGLLAWRLRAATAPAAAMGAAICLLLAQPSSIPGPAVSILGPAASTTDLLRAPGLHALLALFILTFLATRFGRARKERHGLAERRTGRRAAQVLANLGIAALFAASGHLLGALAALAEATADTIASEIGQALAGPTWLLTTGRRVATGTDGGLSLTGTLAGGTAAFLIAAVAGLTLHQLALDAIIFTAGVFGLAFDSLLGATIERRGWIGNDLVNLLSTLAAALCASLIGHLQHATPQTLLALLWHTAAAAGAL